MSYRTSSEIDPTKSARGMTPRKVNKRVEKKGRKGREEEEEERRKRKGMEKENEEGGGRAERKRKKIQNQKK